MRDAHWEARPAGKGQAGQNISETGRAAGALWTIDEAKLAATTMSYTFEHALFIFGCSPAVVIRTPNMFDFLQTNRFRHYIWKYVYGLLTSGHQNITCSPQLPVLPSFFDGPGCGWAAKSPTSHTSGRGWHYMCSNGTELLTNYFTTFHSLHTSSAGLPHAIIFPLGVIRGIQLRL